MYCENLPLRIGFAIFRGVWIFLNNCYVIPTYLVYMVLLRPMLYVAPNFYWALEGRLFHWMCGMVACWMETANYTVSEMGDDVSDIINEGTLVLCNHQSTSDVPVMMHCLQNKGCVIDQILWIMDALFKPTHFGWVSNYRGDFFIKQGKDVRSQQSALLQKHLESKYSSRGRKWVMLFPEGGFLRKRRQASQNYAKKNGYPVLQHVTLPRIGAMKTTLDTLRHTSDANYGIKWVLDITVGYPQRPLDMQTIIGSTRKPLTVSLYYRKYAVDDLPSYETEQLTKWMYDRYEEKERMLEHFYEHGEFPAEEFKKGMPGYRSKPKLLTFPPWYFYFIQSFYFFFTVLELYVLYLLYSCIGSLFA